MYFENKENALAWSLVSMKQIMREAMTPFTAFGITAEEMAQKLEANPAFVRARDEYKALLSTMKLGKQAPLVKDKTLQFEKYVDLSVLPPPPVATNWRANVKVPWGMLGNDLHGDCAEASPAHLEMSYTAANGSIYIPSTSQVIQDYSAITGFNPLTGANDNGSIMLNVMDYWVNTGVCGGRKIWAYTQVNPQNQAMVKTAVSMFGGLNIGMSLPVSCQSQIDWVVTDTTLSGQAAAGSWGGHSIPVIDYDADWVYIVTWSMIKRVGWPFFAAYCDEAYCQKSIDFCNGTKVAPSGFDLATLSQDLQLLNQ